MLERLAEQTQRLGDSARAQVLLTRLLSIQPWHEEAHRQMIRLLASMGQRSAALAHFKTCRTALWTELQVEPAAATVARGEPVGEPLRGHTDWVMSLAFGPDGHPA